MLFGSLLFSCNNNNINPELPETNKSYRLNIKTNTPDIQIYTRAEVDLGNTQIYAYPFGLDNEYDGIPVLPDSISGNNYSYYMPSSKQDIIFSNVLSDSESGYIVSVNTNNQLLQFSSQDPTSGINTDLVIGTLSADSTVTNNTVSHPVQLNRQVAKLSIVMKVIKKNGEIISNLSDYFSKVSLSMSNFYNTCQVDANLQASFEGMTRLIFNTEVNSTENVQTICENQYTFPSCGTDNPALTLQVEYPNGNVTTSSASMSQTVQANTHYKLTLILKQKETETGFILDDFIEEEINVGDFTEF